MKKWVVLEDLTFEEEQDKFDKTYDDSYSEYICTIKFPKETDISATTTTYIFGSYCLYYNSIKPSTSYPYEVFVQQEYITDDLYLLRCGKGSVTGATYGHKEEVILRDANEARYRNIELTNIRFNFTVPAGTVIKVLAR